MFINYRISIDYSLGWTAKLSSCMSLKMAVLTSVQGVYSIQAEIWKKIRCSGWNRTNRTNRTCNYVHDSRDIAFEPV